MSNDNKSSNTTTYKGIGIFGILTVIFVSAKVFGFAPVASWSWFWVLSPLWIGFLISFIFLFLIFLFVWIFS